MFPLFKLQLQMPMAVHHATHDQPRVQVASVTLDLGVSLYSPRLDTWDPAQGLGDKRLWIANSEMEDRQGPLSLA